MSRNAEWKCGLRPTGRSRRQRFGQPLSAVAVCEPPLRPDRGGLGFLRCDENRLLRRHDAHLAVRGPALR
jgi:hypothetical protein